MQFIGNFRHQINTYEVYTIEENNINDRDRKLICTECDTGRYLNKQNGQVKSQSR
jgi:hypothetical protein